MEQLESLPTLEWYIVKVQTNRESSVRDAILRAIKQDALDQYFGSVVVPVQRTIEQGAKRRRVIEEKLFPGYVLIQMRLTDDSWYLIRHVAGVGDFAGVGGVPTPLPAEEVEKLLKNADSSEAPVTQVPSKFKSGERVKITSGAFEGFEGEIEGVADSTGEISVLIEVFGRPTPITVYPKDITPCE